LTAGPTYLTKALTNLERAFDFIESNDSMGPNEAVIVGDRAVNELLKAKLSQVEASAHTIGKQHPDNFPGIIRSLEASGILIPMKDELFRVHRIRNACVHSAETTEIKSARTLLKTIHRFALGFSKYLELDRSQTRLLEVVAKPRIRKPARDLSSPHLFLTSALAALDKADTHHAVRDAMASIETLLVDVAYEDTGFEGLEDILRLRQVQSLFSQRFVVELKRIYPFAKDVIVYYLFTDIPMAKKIVGLAKLAIRQASGRWLSTKHCLICGSARVVGYRLPSDISGTTYRSRAFDSKAYYCSKHKTFFD